MGKHDKTHLAVPNFFVLHGKSIQYVEHGPTFSHWVCWGVLEVYILGERTRDV